MQLVSERRRAEVSAGSPRSLPPSRHLSVRPCTRGRREREGSQNYPEGLEDKAPTAVSKTLNKDVL